jgi:hypothetical protein
MSRACIASGQPIPAQVPNCADRNPPFYAVKHPARPYNTATQGRFSIENAETA